MLSAMFVAAIAMQSCEKTRKHEDKWISGKSTKKDTVINNHSYRHYGGMWYPIYAGRINPGQYEGFSHSTIHSSNTSRITPTKISTSSSSSHSSGFRSGGFGSSSHFSSGS